MTRLQITDFCALTLEARDPGALARFYAECFGLAQLSSEGDRLWLAAGPSARLGLWQPGRSDRSLYVRDPEGNMVEAWDHFERGRTVDSLCEETA